MKIWPALLLVFGCPFFDLSSAQIPDSDSISTPSYGPLCEVSQYQKLRCLKEATCNSQKCQCPNGQIGDGTFLCNHPEDQRLELTGYDNLLQPWNNSLEAPFPLACRNRLTEFVIEKSNEKKKCHFQIFGDNKAISGSVMVSAVEIHLKIVQDSKPIYERGIRLSAGKIGLMSNTYEYKEEVKSTFIQEGPETYTELPDDEMTMSGSGMGDIDDEDGDVNQGMSHTTIDDEDSTEHWSPSASLSGTVDRDGVVKIQVDANSVAKVIVKECGAEINFRPGDDKLLTHGLKSGLAVIIDPDIDQVKFSKPDEYIAGSPLIDGNKKLKMEYSLTQTQLLIHIAMEYAAVQSDGEGDTCRDLGFVYRAYCTTNEKKTNALKHCSNVITDKTKQSCLDDQGLKEKHGGALQVFKMCIRSYCTTSLPGCQLLKTAVTNTNCLDQHSKDALLSLCPGQKI